VDFLLRIIVENS